VAAYLHDQVFARADTATSQTQRLEGMLTAWPCGSRSDARGITRISTVYALMRPRASRSAEGLIGFVNHDGSAGDLRLLVLGGRPEEAKQHRPRHAVTSCR